jgi:hypothetical protein
MRSERAPNRPDSITAGLVLWIWRGGFLKSRYARCIHFQHPSPKQQARCLVPATAPNFFSFHPWKAHRISAGSSRFRAPTRGHRLCSGLAIIKKAPFISPETGNDHARRDVGWPLLLKPRIDGMPKEAHTKAAEHHESAAKSHRTAAEHHGKGDHAKASEESTKAQGHSKTARDHSETAHSKSQSHK